MTRALAPADIEAAFQDACRTELDALKPGNVHRHGDHARMSVADFEKSAAASAPELAREGLQVGARIKSAVDATSRAVGHNTNLGIILLCAPLAHAALDKGSGSLRGRLGNILAALDLADASNAYAGIRQAKAGGLGDVAEHDIASEPRITLIEAMREAEGRDRIAWNYVHDFADIFERGVPRLRQTVSQFGSKIWGASFVYLGFLAETPDTLIVRKFGAATAAQVVEEARLIQSALKVAKRPDLAKGALLEFDRSLKARGLNPGTSADLTVASLFADSLDVLERAG